MFHITLAKKYEAACKKAHDSLDFSVTLKIPGFNKMKIFVAFTPVVQLANGSHADIVVGRSTNKEFSDAYGERFLAVGTKFTKKGIREQYAVIANALLQVRLDSQVKEALEEIATMCNYSGDFTEQIMVGDHLELKADSSARRYIILSKMFGEKTARHVIYDAIDQQMASTKLAAKVASKAANKAEEQFNEKSISKDILKSSKADVKKNIKERSDQVKQAKKDTKKAAKATKKKEKTKLYR